MAVTTDTLDDLDRVRAALRRAVVEVTSLIDSEWARAWEALADEWQAAVEDAVAGADTTPGIVARLDREQRVRDALDHITGELDRLVAVSHAAATAAVTGVVRAAVDSTQALAVSQLPLGRAVAWTDPTKAALDAIVKRTGEQITALHRPLSDDATARVKAHLVRSVAAGENPRATARRITRGIEAEFNGARNRALVIARTELLDAHRAASRETRSANTAVLAGWTWCATLDRRTCPACLAMHGTRHPAGEAGPLGHQQCRCTALPLTRSWRDLGFDLDEPDDVLPDARAWFDAQPPAVQDHIVGRRVAAALRSGDVEWSALATRRSTSGWRDSYTTTPTSALLPRRTA